MAQAARLLEVLFRLRAVPRVTVGELAETLGVSRRTMLRDLHALSAMGIPLLAIPGPGGGYALARDQRLPPLPLTVEEALALLLSYEAFLQNAPSPFAAASLSAATKLRGILPPDILGELDELRRHVAIIERPRERESPLLGAILRASLDRAHLRVVYESLGGRSERSIFPFGLFAQGGFWYCACYDYTREMNISLRADRFISVATEAGPEPPPHISPATWNEVVERSDEPGLPLRVVVSARGMRRGDLPPFIGRPRPDGAGGGVIAGGVPPGEVEFFATTLLTLGTDVRVESPPELVAAMRRRIGALAALYEG